MTFDPQPEPSRGPTPYQLARLRRAGMMAAQAVTLSDHYLADREYCDTQTAREMVWRTYAMALMVELHRRDHAWFTKPRKARVDATLAVISTDQRLWKPEVGPVRWTLWQRRSIEELEELHITLERARMLKTEEQLDATTPTPIRPE